MAVSSNLISIASHGSKALYKFMCKMLPIIYHLTSDLKKVYNSAVQYKIVYKYLLSGICSWILHSLFICSVLYLWMETVETVFKNAFI
jgi:hypothetical protein